MGRSHMETWLLTAGEGLSVIPVPVAIVVGNKREAEKAAERITINRKKLGHPENMVSVRVQHVIRVDKDGKAV